MSITSLQNLKFHKQYFYYDDRIHVIHCGTRKCIMITFWGEAFFWEDFLIDFVLSAFTTF